MPAKAFLWVLCLLTFISPALTQAQESDALLRPVLERAYNQWRQAMLTQNAEAWAGSVTRYRQVVIRNSIVSQRKPFPAAVFQVPIYPPPVEGLRLLEVQAVGTTAHLIYFGKVNAGGDESKIPDAILMLKFFKEPTGWKFDSSKLLKLGDEPELLTKLRKGETPDFLDRPEFTPPGVTPPVPPLCNVPQNVAACTVQSFGYETQMSINGFSYPLMADQAEKFLIIGGVNTGSNEIILTVKKTDIPQGEPRLLQIDIFLPPTKEGGSGIRVYHYESKSGDLTGTIRLPVILDAETLRTGL